MTIGYLAGVIFALLLYGVWLLRPSKAKRRESFSPTVQLVLDMLADGSGWEFSPHSAKHVTGAAIWISNGAGNAGLNLNRNASPENLINDNITTTQAERTAMYQAAKALQARGVDAKMNEARVQWAKRVSEYADNVVSINSMRA